MPFERKLVGEPAKDRGRTLTARYMGPDLLAYVDDLELAGFYLDAEAAHQAGMRHVDAEEKAKAERERGARR